MDDFPDFLYEGELSEEERKAHFEKQHKRAAEEVAKTKEKLRKAMDDLKHRKKLEQRHSKLNFMAMMGTISKDPINFVGKTVHHIDQCENEEFELVNGNREIYLLPIVNNKRIRLTIADNPRAFIRVDFKLSKPEQMNTFYELMKVRRESWKVMLDVVHESPIANISWSAQRFPNDILISENHSDKKDAPNFIMTYKDVVV